MANISVRNLDDNVQAELKARARKHGRSMEAEIRQILADAAKPAQEPADPFASFFDACREMGGVELELPPREFSAPIDLSGQEYA